MEIIFKGLKLEWKKDPGKKSVELEFSFIEELDIGEGHKAQSSSSLDRYRQTETILIMFQFIYSLPSAQLTAFSLLAL